MEINVNKDGTFMDKSQIVKDILDNSRIDSSFRDSIKSTDKNELSNVHSSFCRWIRNSYGLWYSDNPYTGITNAVNHPEVYSFEVLELLWETLNAGL